MAAVAVEVVATAVTVAVEAATAEEVVVVEVEQAATIDISVDLSSSTSTLSPRSMAPKVLDLWGQAASWVQALISDPVTLLPMVRFPMVSTTVIQGMECIRSTRLAQSRVIRPEGTWVQPTTG